MPEWYVSGGLALGSILFLMFLSMPVAFAFLLVSFGGMYLLAGVPGMSQVAANASVAVTHFVFLPIPLFLLMGELFFNAGVARKVFDAVDMLTGRMRGRLSYVTIFGGTTFAALTGTSMGNTAMLGSLLVPEMTRRGYAKHMSMGPILGVGGLAILIPPSGLGVLLGSLARIDIGQLLIAGVLPGLVLALLYLLLVYAKIQLDPDCVPPPEDVSHSLREKLVVIVTHILPLSIIVFMVIGLILLGIATPTESAAFGVLGVLIVAAAFGGLTLESIVKSLRGTVRVTAMILLIVAASSTFSQVLAFSGATSGMIRAVGGAELSPAMVIVVMFAILLFMGMFMDQASIMMLTIPIFFPIAQLQGFDLVWFGVVMLLALEMSGVTPPFGLNLFVMLGVAPKGTTMVEVAKSGLPYLACGLLLFVLLVFEPNVALYLPSLMDN
ncbi:MAG: TRAP transporter large permease subunit [Albidovulum sp.]|nr:TRAP transporter large permease subunit [Albidovulum sp.]MDE0307181.1 TRAP transporter large permease subunit [Albidovulum sp.]MDE0531909.1 TRAP transporter large permease subunit [Albidovulum sp.]